MINQTTATATKTNQSVFPVNPDLVWDYDIPSEGEQSEAFRRWYIARVLTRGQARDIKAIGFDMIYSYLPSLTLPAEIRHFWEWYFSLPEVKQRYGHTYPSATPVADSHCPDSPEP